MRNIVFIILLLSLIFSCSDRSAIDKPIVANNFNDFLISIDKACRSIDPQSCEHVWGLMNLYLPELKDSSYIPSSDQKATVLRLYNRFNHKSPRELLMIYKGDMSSDIQSDINQDDEITTQLDDIFNQYKNSKRYIRNFPIRDIQTDFNPTITNLMWTISNNSKLKIKQLVANVEYHSSDGKFIAKSADFIYKFDPYFTQYDRFTILVEIDSISANKLNIIKNSKNIKTKISILSVITNTDKLLLFQLPDSYFRMRKLIAKSIQLHKDRINLVESINTE